ncbi:hypothetical protein GCM10028801_02500 [Nocardioides maradonensis]
MSRLRSAGLDQLRGIAIALVLLRHLTDTLLPGPGVVGVVMFFSISGYLITGVLMRDLAEHGRFRAGHFYARRAWRLVPALLVVVAVLVVVTLVLDPVGDRGRLPRTVAVALTWTADLPFQHGSTAIFHLWTLAMEEQFYLLWPLVLVLAVRTRRPAPVLAGAGLLCLLACVVTVVHYRHALDLAYPLPTSWAGCFVIGGAARWWSDRVPVVTRSWPLLLPLVVLCFVPLRGHAATYLLGAPLIAALTAVLARSWHDRNVQNRIGGALAALGTVSYAAYLWDYPLTVWLRPIGWYGGPLALLLTLVAAAASWRYLERPLLRWRDRERAPSAALAGAR